MPATSRFRSTAADEDIAYYFRLQYSSRPTRPLPLKDILVVDDHPESVAPVVRMLRHDGCEADCVESAAAALTRLAARRPRLVLLDIAMPQMDGIELLKELRRRPETENLPVIMLTADPLRADEALQLGALDYIVKPIDLPALRKRLAKYL